MSYHSRKSPNGVVMGSEVLWEAYVKSKYGSYAAWWRSNRHSSVLTMRVKFCNWRIAEEKRYGFISDDQKAGMSKSFERMLAEAKQLAVKLRDLPEYQLGLPKNSIQPHDNFSHC